MNIERCCSVQRRWWDTMTGENRVFGAEHASVPLVGHKSHVDGPGFEAGLRGECLNHIDMDTLLHCYIATLLPCYSESVQSQFATVAARSQQCCPSVSTTQQTQTVSLLKMDNLKRLKSNQQVKSAVRRRQVQTFRKDVRHSAFGLISEKHNQCSAFA